jgi:dihydropteroate synthase
MALQAAGGPGPSWRLDLPGGREWQLGRVPAVVGIINVTPDSFSDGGRYPTSEDAVEAGLRMLREGAAGLDVGGESTRPGAPPVPVEEEMRRVLPVIRGLRGHTEAPISVDTRSPEVARSALEAGADIVNDVNGFREPGWQALLRGRPVPLIVVHMQGEPRTMQEAPRYPEGVVKDVERFFDERIDTLESWGVDRSRLLLDPGIGFGKRLGDNLDLLRDLSRFLRFERPLYVGVSRKGFIAKVLGRELSLAERDAGTTAVNAAAMLGGANVLRVHNVPCARDMVRLVSAVREGGSFAQEAAVEGPGRLRSQ